MKPGGLERVRSGRETRQSITQREAWGDLWTRKPSRRKRAARLASQAVRPHTGLMPAYTMSRQVVVVLYVVAMVAIIVASDFAFFRNRFWERLMVNIGIVLVFAAFYFRFLKPS
jgi:hypothetical protein